MFFRGLDLAAGIDFSRTVEQPGGYEADALKDHTHGTDMYPGKAGAGGSIGGQGTDKNGSPTGGIKGPDGGAIETRPKNIGLIPILNI